MLADSYDVRWRFRSCSFSQVPIFSKNILSCQISSIIFPIKSVNFTYILRNAKDICLQLVLCCISLQADTSHGSYAYGFQFEGIYKMRNWGIHRNYHVFYLRTKTFWKSLKIYFNDPKWNISRTHAEDIRVWIRVGELFECLSCFQLLTLATFPDATRKSWEEYKAHKLHKHLV